MAENTTEAVSTATETPVEGSSSTDTQTEGQEQATTQETAQQAKERLDWRRIQREDADLNAHVQSEISKARTRWQRQQLRATAKSAADSENADAALDIARTIAQEQDEPDENEAHDADWSRSADRVQPQLERLLQIDKDGRATNPHYVALHQREGKAAMDKRYAEDPVGFVNWVDDQIMEMRVDAKVKKVAPSLAGAMATDEANARLRGMPLPLGGSNSANGALTLQSYEGMTFEQRQKLRKENPRLIDEMIARAAR